jgi:Holliday junction resolvase RusA-like endonuclease
MTDLTLEDLINWSSPFDALISSDVQWDLSFWVPGRPQTAGSKSAVPTKAGVRVLESGSKESRAAKRMWRQDVRGAAKEALRDTEGEGWPCSPETPIAVEFRFVRKRNDTHYGTGRNTGVLKEWARDLRPTMAPDVLKWARAAEDALEQVLWQNDACIVEEHLSKWYPDQVGLPRGTEGCQVNAQRLAGEG